MKLGGGRERGKELPKRVVRCVHRLRGERGKKTSRNGLSSDGQGIGFRGGDGGKGLDNHVLSKNLKKEGPPERGFGLAQRAGRATGRKLKGGSGGSLATTIEESSGD